jgi:hypothetical protein
MVITMPLQNRAIPRLGRAHGDPTILEQIVLANDSVQTEKMITTIVTELTDQFSTLKFRN